MGVLDFKAGIMDSESQIPDRMRTARGRGGEGGGGWPVPFTCIVEREEKQSPTLQARVHI